MDAANGSQAPLAAQYLYLIFRPHLDTTLPGLSGGKHNSPLVGWASWDSHPRQDLCRPSSLRDPTSVGLGRGGSIIVTTSGYGAPSHRGMFKGKLNRSYHTLRVSADFCRGSRCAHPYALAVLLQVDGNVAKVLCLLDILFSKS